MSNKLLALIAIVLIVGIVTTTVFTPNKETERFELYGYVDELYLLRNATFVFNSTDAGEALQWTIDNLNGTDAVIASKGGQYWVGIIDDS